MRIVRRHLLMLIHVGATLLAVSPAEAFQVDTYDVLLKGGHVIDPRNQINGVRDVAIRDSLIARVDTDIPVTAARQVIDVRGFHVTPGYIDLHVHVAYPDWPHALKPEDNTFSAGVTTMVDVGSAGWETFPGFKARVIDETRARVLVFLYVVGPGLSGQMENEGRTNVAGLAPELTAAMAKRYPETIVGIKVKGGRNQETTPPGAPAWAQLDAALEAGRLAGLPVMLDFWPWPPHETFEAALLEKLRPGDIFTHIFNKMYPSVLEDGRVNPALAAAQQRGVILDVGHGQASFMFRNAVPAIGAGVYPSTISSDLHRGTVNGPAVDLLNVMSKFLVMGMPLEEVIRRATVTPADAIRRPELGSLSVGAEADIAVVELRHGRFGYSDVRRAKLIGDRKLESRLTFRAGRIVYDPAGYSMPEWRDAPKEYWEGVIKEGQPF